MKYFISCFLSLFLLITNFLPWTAFAEPSFEEIGLRAEIARIDLIMQNLEALDSKEISDFWTSAEIREIAGQVLDVLPSHMQNMEIRSSLEDISRTNISRKKWKTFLSELQRFLHASIQEREGKRDSPTYLRQMSRWTSFIRVVYFETESQKIEMTGARLRELSYLDNTYDLKKLARTIGEDFYHIRNHSMSGASDLKKVQENLAAIETFLYILGSPGTTSVRGEETSSFLSQALKLVLMLEQEPEFLRTFSFLYRQILLLINELHIQTQIQFDQMKAPKPAPRRDDRPRRVDYMMMNVEPQILIHPDGSVSIETAQTSIFDVFDRGLTRFLSILSLDAWRDTKRKEGKRMSEVREIRGRR